MPEDMRAAPRPTLAVRLGALTVATLVGARPRRQRDRAGREGVDRGDARAQMSELAHQRPHVAGHDALAPIRGRLPLRRAMHLMLAMPAASQQSAAAARDRRRRAVRMIGAPRSRRRRARTHPGRTQSADRSSILACSHGMHRQRLGGLVARDHVAVPVAREQAFAAGVTDPENAPSSGRRARPSARASAPRPRRRRAASACWVASGSQRGPAARASGGRARRCRARLAAARQPHLRRACQPQGGEQPERRQREGRMQITTPTARALTLTDSGSWVPMPGTPINCRHQAATSPRAGRWLRPRVQRIWSVTPGNLRPSGVSR